MLCCAKATPCCALPSLCESVLRHRCANPCDAIAVFRHALPLRVSARSKRRASQPCARSVATAMRCSALPWLCNANPCPRRACPRRPTPSPRIANQSCANAVRVLALASQTAALPKRGHAAHCLAIARPSPASPAHGHAALCRRTALPCLADAWPCWALPSRCAAPPSGALPLRRHASLSPCALFCALPSPCGPSGCLAVAKRAVAMPLLGRALQRPRKSMHGQRRDEQGIAAATGA